MRKITLGWLLFASTTPFLASLYAQTPAVPPVEAPPGTVIDHQFASTRQYIGSPSIVVAGNGDYVASHDLFGPGSTSTVSAVSKVFVSHDRGATWNQTAELTDQFWSNLFVHAGRLYLMGTTYEYGKIVIRESLDNGAHWSEGHLLTSDTGYHTAPVPMAFRDGKVYRAFEFHPQGPWGNFQALMLSASDKADLTDPKSWTKSERLAFPAGDEGRTWLEGNALIGLKGEILDVLRVDNRERAAVLEFSNNKPVVRQFVDMPGGAKKFTIRYDSRSKLFWSLVNPALPGEPLTVSTPASVRNTLAMISSPDLTHWSARSIVMQHPDSAAFGFQYVDWQFDGDDVIAAVRASFTDSAGGAHNYHDANFLLFTRVSDFRSAKSVALSGRPFDAAEVEDAALMKKWSSMTLTDAQRSPAHAGVQPIGNYENHTVMLTTRTATGLAEQHRDWSDIFYVVEGKGAIVTGGRLVNAATIADGEQRAAGVEGGTSVALETGAVIHIDPGIAHQLVLKEGIPFTYFVVKVRRERGTSRDSDSMVPLGPR